MQAGRQYFDTTLPPVPCSGLRPVHRDSLFCRLLHAKTCILPKSRLVKSLHEHVIPTFCRDPPPFMLTLQADGIVHDADATLLNDSIEVPPPRKWRSQNVCVPASPQKGSCHGTFLTEPLGSCQCTALFPLVLAPGQHGATGSHWHETS